MPDAKTTSLILLWAVGVSMGLLNACSRQAQVNQEQVTVNQITESQTESPLPPPTGYVNDYANIFDPESKQRLESVLSQLRDKANIEFAVVTIDSTEGQPIFDYSLAVARGWGIGPKDDPDGGGLLLLYAIRDRQWRLQVSRSLEEDLPDDVCKALGEKSADSYRRGDYVKGIELYVKEIISRLEKTKGFSV